MRVLIVGAGTIGTNLATALVKEGQDVTVLDADPVRLGRLENNVDCQVVCGNAISPATLEEVGIRSTDLVIALTQDDTTNMAVCQLASHYGVERKLARLRDPELTAPEPAVPSAALGIDRIISPERLTVDHIEHLIECPGARDAIDFEDGRVSVRALVVSPESELVDKTVSQVRLGIPGRYLLMAIRRGGRMIIPHGDEHLRAGDAVYLIAAPDQIEELVTAFDPEATPARHVIIFGAGVAGVELAARLVGKVKRIVLMEPDMKRAEAAATRLDHSRVEVLHGSALDEDLMRRSGMDSCDCFVAISDDDEENFMSALMFRRSATGTPMVVTAKPESVDILESVGLDVAINPHTLAVSALLHHLRGSTVLSVAKLKRETTELVELEVGDGSRITQQPLSDLHLDRGLLIAAVLRERELFIPGGTFQIKAGDRILVLNDSQENHLTTRLVKPG